MWSEVHATKINVQQVVVKMDKLAQCVNKTLSGEIFACMTIWMGLIERYVEPL